MTQPFPVIDIPLNSPDEIENLGTKAKFWFQHHKFGKCLFKKARPGTGEDWAEKIAAELCSLLKLPHANYELAIFNGARGTISPSFIPDRGSLSLGNEILAKEILSYPKGHSSPSQHTVNQIFTTLNRAGFDIPFNWMPPDEITNPAEVFLGYLLLDAWISNTDRHHENWGVIQLNGATFLAPTYDHASNLGRNLQDKERSNRLRTQDQGYSVEAFVKKGKSCLYGDVSDSKPLKVYDAFCTAARMYPQVTRFWLKHLSKISQNDTLVLLNKIPCELISPIAIEFAQKILEINKSRLLYFESELI